MKGSPFCLLPFAFCLLSSAPAFAQIAMPDPSAIAGTPLPAPELPDSTVTVRVVRERMGNNIAGQPVTLRVGGATRTGTTDAQGRAQFDGLPAGTRVQATTTVDGETLTSQEFAVPAKGGVRVALIAGIQKAAAAERAAAAAGAREPARPGVVEFGPESRIILEFQDDNLTLFYLLEVTNNARTPIDIGGPLILQLPTGASGAVMLEGSSPQASVLSARVTITGPFPPGKLTAQVGFSLPNASSDLVLTQKWPAALSQVFVAAEKIGPMHMSSPQLTDIRETPTEGGVFLMGMGGRIEPGGTLTVHLTGMPAANHIARNAALAIVILILGVGVWMAMTPGSARAAQDGKLAGKRERLMGDIVALERKRQTRALTAAEAARLQRLTADLERVLASLDQAPVSRDEGVHLREDASAFASATADKTADRSA
jgi:hypothetical protein